MTAPKVGDVVAWADVPNGAMVREVDGRAAGKFTVRRGRLGYIVSPDAPSDSWHPFIEGGAWEWSASEATQATIVALGLTGQETAADLQRLAEVFEAREFILSHGDTRGWERAWGVPVDSLAERLHAAGWRAGMTAEDAARMLTGAGS